MSQENNFVPEQENYKPLSPFKLFVKSNFPFIEETYEALDNYGLYCKIVEYLNTVIENENTVEENVSALYNSFVSLNEYVSNYFDNLDVQNEINNKLDEMASSGELQDLLNRQYNALRNEVYHDLDIIDAKVDALSSGSPAGVYATVEALQADNPDHSKIYVVTADGKWYYYNNGWTVGGTYQSTGIADGSIGFDKLDSFVNYRIKTDYYYENVEASIRDGYWISKTLVEYTSAAASYARASVTPLETYVISAWQQNATYPAIMFFNGTTLLETYSPESQDYYSNVEIKAPLGATDVYVNGKTITYTNTYKPRIKKKIFYNMEESIDNVNDRVNEVTQLFNDYHDITSDITMNSGGFYNYQQMKVQTYSGFSYSDNVECKAGEKFKITATAQGNAYKVVFVDVSGQTITQSNDSEVTVPKNTSYCIFNCADSGLSNFKIEKLEIDAINIDTIIQEYESFNNFEISNLKRRCLNSEKKNDFDWSTFDKTYFCFVIDDCNSHLPATYDLFHSKNVPLSVGAIVSRLSTDYDGRTVKEILEAVESDNGEILAHYTGNLADPGYSDGVHTFLTTNQAWNERTRDVKKKLEEEGFTVNGIMRADYTQRYSNKGQEICRNYFDYSDDMGKTKQYKMQRIFFSGYESIEALESRIDLCCQTPRILSILFTWN